MGVFFLVMVEFPGWFERLCVCVCVCVICEYVCLRVCECTCECACVYAQRGMLPHVVETINCKASEPLSRPP